MKQFLLGLETTQAAFNLTETHKCLFFSLSRCVFKIVFVALLFSYRVAGIIVKRGRGHDKLKARFTFPHITSFQDAPAIIQRNQKSNEHKQLLQCLMILEIIVWINF